MIDSKKVLYLPNWVKVFTVIALAVCLAASVVVSLAFIGVPGHSDWILLALSLAQVSATALIFSLILIFGEREASIDFLKQKTDLFLTRQVPKLFRLIEDNYNDHPKITISAPNNIFGVNYHLQTPNLQMKMWLGVNVDRVIVIYFVKDIDIEKAKQVFSYTFGGAESVGYKVNYEAVTFPDTQEEIVSIWCTWPKIQNAENLATDLLSHPEKKLFIIQDIAMMTQSFIRVSQREQIDVHPQADPGPL